MDTSVNEILSTYGVSGLNVNIGEWNEHITKLVNLNKLNDKI